MDLVGYTGTGASHTNWRPFGFNLVERLDRLYASGRIGPCVVALPDCFTCYGGNQYVNSVGMGRYMDHVCDEVVPFVEGRYPTTGFRGVFGKSSGGYGAMVHAMMRPDVWHAAVCHSGDMYFEYGYLTDFPRLLRELLKTGGDLEAWLRGVWSRGKLTHDETMALMCVGMAASYDNDPDAPLGFRLPFDTRDGRIDWERWARWTAMDPVRMIPDHVGALRGLRGLWIDCGTRDQFHLLWGARQAHQLLADAEVPHVYEEFDDDHSDVDYRMERSLPQLWAWLAGPKE